MQHLTHVRSHVSHPFPPTSDEILDHLEKALARYWLSRTNNRQVRRVLHYDSSDTTYLFNRELATLYIW
jgi:hypothetical protein